MLIADTHVHIYPVYQAAALLDTARANLNQLAEKNPAPHVALFLTERRDCGVFSDWSNGKNIPPGYSIEATAEASALLLTKEQNGQTIFLFAGRQFVSSQGIEVLSLTSNSEADESRSTADIISAVRDAGGVPVLSWAPGKWTGKRGAIVRSLVASNAGKPLLIGDTCMRASGFPEPALFNCARVNGIPVAAGTDPLPFAADEKIAGTYGIKSDVFDEKIPVTSARTLLTQGSFTICGRRSSLPVSINRWLSNRAAKPAS